MDKTLFMYNLNTSGKDVSPHIMELYKALGNLKTSQMVCCDVKVSILISRDETKEYEG